MPLTVLRVPSDEELLSAVNTAAPAHTYPPVSVKKILASFRRTHPNWKVTERRLKKLRNLGGGCPRESLGSDDTDVHYDSSCEDGAPWLLIADQDGIDDEEYVLVNKDSVGA
mmetsp:Transcript_39044/g.97748  ORF Transcript_39044/g.97748 Transcript_39044/m.97748 type:complete len:112 (+) Transcript_39044:204-539(+)|eukprot:CAMPEP_0173470202 /NCGR_PEP_ID=MMETSP1357-20121228/77757_1 /TAXON_ID=77926 /ORGANISM="Hemiselmis rufescens, Strain PCC563" /LENGTH=111 /DNA_ID=CAMNT_0014438469 /DNA_START=191 /DNA_END=526 /DNA_ORIENTATION=-